MTRHRRVQVRSRLAFPFPFAVAMAALALAAPGDRVADAPTGWSTAVPRTELRPSFEFEQWGTLALAEVDLDERLHWPSLGDFKADLHRHRPVWEPEPVEPGTGTAGSDPGPGEL